MAESGSTGGGAGRHRARGTLHAVSVPPGNRKPRIPAEKLADVDQLLGDPTLGRNEIARRTGVSVDTVSRRAAMLGRSFSGSAAVAVAHEVKVQDGRSKRRQLAERLLDDAITEAGIRDQLDRNEVRDAQARANLSRSLGTLVKAVADLDSIEVRYRELEAGRRAVSDMDEWLEHMTGTGGE
jgi:hypothetical protein